ncbi:protein FATTY ACID EXPORT 3, chloroplastic [Quillaja saponaria]|uniref:Protein FATTY ACID EXPORT 3, chloroplastic n=1 Tax=Quillaja saponaria TaxID=32244 RepID=A0AAD7LN98_QUISA|nr:protein FATTY ACID EXPORT 3, chloroplastic [Quillaja saponaria]KAJ7961073.1 protein FATTY ACID EXPORT 3, chloroplastic [Quillaja saponaria]
MSSTFESVLALNPNPRYGLIPLKKKSMALSSLQFLKYDSIPRTSGYKVSLVATGASQKWLGTGFLTIDSTTSWNRLTVASAASREDPLPEIEVEKEQDEHKLGSVESQEAWKQALDSFKEQALKIQSVSQEAYELYSKKAIVILQDTAEQLKIQTDKATHDLSVVAKEISEEGKEYLSLAAEHSPEPVKEIVETFTSSTDNLNEISSVHDFYIGIPYGLILSVGGFLSFMITGSIAAIRFGVILGGALLVLSVSSLRSYRRRESFPLALKGQAAFASIIFLRNIGLLSKGASVLSYFNTLISGAVVAFYVYRINLDRKEKRSNFESGTEN